MVLLVEIKLPREHEEKSHSKDEGLAPETLRNLKAMV